MIPGIVSTSHTGYVGSTRITPKGSNSGASRTSFGVPVQNAHTVQSIRQKRGLKTHGSISSHHKEPTKTISSSNII